MASKKKVAKKKVVAKKATPKKKVVAKKKAAVNWRNSFAMLNEAYSIQDFDLQ